MNLVTPTDGMLIEADTTFQPGVYHLPDGIQVVKRGVTLDANGAVLVGANRQGIAVTIEADEVTVKNLKARDYYQGIRAEGVKGLMLKNNSINCTAEIQPNTVFLDIWRDADEAYGGAIMLNNVRESTIEDNDLQHNMNGLLTYACSGLTVQRNQCNYCSGFGIHLHGTCDSLFQENSADYCCRFEPREGGLHFGHMGADATGFLVVYGSCRNRFIRNTARLGGDGFFVAGLGPNGENVGCDDNLFEGNDGSLSPNIAFECTFSKGNVFRNNYADRCNFGFWLGWTTGTIVEGNRVVMNRQAGVAVENGIELTIRGNTFQGNGHGVLAWSQAVAKFLEDFPNHHTSRDWTIEGNTFTRNGKGIRVATDQDHGIRPSAENPGQLSSRPQVFAIRENDIQDNRIGIDLYGADKVRIHENVLNRNVEANLRQDDCAAEFFRNNLGAAGAYL